MSLDILAIDTKTFIAVHGNYEEIRPIKLPPHICFIETGIIDEATYSEMEIYLKSLLYNTEHLYYLLYCDSGVTIHNYNAQMIRRSEAKKFNKHQKDLNKYLQHNLLLGNYSNIIKSIQSLRASIQLPTGIIKLMKELEMFERVIKAITIYWPGDILYNRVLTINEEGSPDSTTEFLSEETFDTINKEEFTYQDIITLFPTPQLIIISSCGKSAVDGIRDIEMHQDQQRNKFYALRDNNSGLEKPEVEHQIEDIYVAGKWFYDGDTLFFSYEEFARNYVFGNGDAKTAGPNTQASVLSQNTEWKIIIEKKKYKYLTFINLNSSMPVITTSNRITVEEPTITKNSLDNFITQTNLDTLYYVDQKSMYLIKMSFILGLHDIKDVNPTYAALYMNHFFWNRNYWHPYSDDKHIGEIINIVNDKKFELVIPTLDYFQKHITDELKAAIAHSEHIQNITNKISSIDYDSDNELDISGSQREFLKLLHTSLENMDTTSLSIPTRIEEIVPFMEYLDSLTEDIEKDINSIMRKILPKGTPTGPVRRKPGGGAGVGAGRKTKKSRKNRRTRRVRR